MFKTSLPSSEIDGCCVTMKSTTGFGHDLVVAVIGETTSIPGPEYENSSVLVLSGCRCSDAVLTKAHDSHLLSLSLFFFQDGGWEGRAGHAWTAVCAPRLPSHRVSLDAAAGLLPEDEAYQQPPGPFWPRE